MKDVIEGPSKQEKFTVISTFDEMMVVHQLVTDLLGGKILLVNEFVEG